MAQLVEHILGKDEVPSSNLGSSSRHPRGFMCLGALVFKRENEQTRNTESSGKCVCSFSIGEVFAVAKVKL